MCVGLNLNRRRFYTQVEMKKKDVKRKVSISLHNKEKQLNLIFLGTKTQSIFFIKLIIQNK